MKPYSAADFQASMDGPDPRMEELAYLQARLGPAAELLVQQQPLAGTVMTEQGPMDVAAAIAIFVAAPVRYRFGTWVVTEDGVACLVRHVTLTHARLQEKQNWASHLAEQDWVNLWDLLRALAVEHQHGATHPGSGPYGDGAHPS
jgi:hypothetical protein